MYGGRNVRDFAVHCRTQLPAFDHSDAIGSACILAARECRFGVLACLSKTCCADDYAKHGNAIPAWIRHQIGVNRANCFAVHRAARRQMPLRELLIKDPS